MIGMPMCNWCHRQGIATVPYKKGFICRDCARMKGLSQFWFESKLENAIRGLR